MADMTVEERLTALEATLTARLAAIETQLAAHQAILRHVRIIEHYDPDYGTIYGWMFTGCRVGVSTDFWMRQNRGQGAAFSVGTDFDRFGVYVEMEGAQQACPDNATVAIYAAALPPGPQPNIGVLATATHARDQNGVSRNYSLFLDNGGDRHMTFQREGMQLIGSWSSFLIGKMGATIKALWP